jgi:hypothetical protein
MNREESMRARDVKKLHSGDEVTWTDPDGGLCSKTFIIGSIEHVEGDIFRIVDREGGEIEVLARELS